ncbi:uncharacterized protein FIESC28_04906 [Fusarium coffeatum]|uniref:Uncharacterized protein n=1 Tax=Fusarium coffeatum TaxID=231269 RepID=A0A366RWB7_9HYPO|nr:uncharacterized protein FIESC28_04906 [Fusarium coffeatum]RBR21369.1 hypothetical protein FIESC28_04906 [Fusarium coffeatum]
MPTTRKGGKPNQRARIQSQSLQIGQLETTPTSRHLQSRRVDDKPDPPSAQQPPQASANEYEDKIDDADLIVLNDELDVPKDFWSEAASTHRSTPAPEAGRAHFDSPSSVIDDFSSLRSGSGKLPSTQPLPSQLVARPEANNYDFLETATTARRSSPVQPHNTLSRVALDRAWEYPKNNTVPELPGTIPDSYQVPELDAMKHLPENELYDATPASEEELQDAPKQPQVTTKSKPPQKAGAKRKATKGVKKAKAAVEILEEEVGPADEEPSVSPSEQPKPKRQKLGKTSEQVQKSPAVQTPKSTEAKGSVVRRGKQKFKPALEFDEKTQQVIDKSPNQSGHMSMVESMRQAHAASVSPIESTKKSTPKPRKKPSPRAVTKAAPKAAPKPSPRVTTKASPKPSRKAAAVAARRITRQSALAEELTQPSSEEVISPAVEQAEPVTKTSDAATKKTATKTIVKTEPLLQPAKAQAEPKGINDTQGSTENPILLSSAGSSSSLSDAGDFVPFNDQAEVPPVKQATAREKSITVRADPKEPLLQRTNRPPIRIGPGEVLSARDANMLAQYNASKANTLKRTATARDTLVDTSAPPRKTMKRSRSFSVSRAGSPLPVDATNPVEDTSPIYEEEDEPEPILPHTHKQINGLQQGYLSGLAAAKSMPARTRVLVKEKPKEKPRVEPTLPKDPIEEVAEELHGHVKAMLHRLQSSEHIIYRAADAYQKNSIDGVEKIGRRYEQEKRILSKTWKRDGDRFIRGARAARAALDKQRELREEVTRQMQEAVATRQHLYQKAITSLHALQGQLTQD